MPSIAGDFYNAPLYSPKIHYSYQVAFSKSPSIMSSPSRELPMPVVTRIVTLTQAQATLQHCLTRLSKSWQGSPLTNSERRNFQQWLEQWEQAFTTFLSFTMSTMKGEEITCCRILKANHLACTVLASDGASDSAYDASEAECQAIVELAAIILRARRLAGASDMASASNPTAGALDVKDPLRVVAARCEHAKIRGQASEMLSAISGR